MNTATRELRPIAPDVRDTADDLGSGSTLRVRLRAVGAPGREVADRRPRVSRPGGVDLYRRGPVRTPASHRPRAAHPVPSVEQAQLGFAVLAVAALLSALVVAGLLGLAHWRAGAVVGPDSSTSIPAEIGQQPVYGDFPR
ncbi:hypothetical protein [Nocardia xishanensis]